MLELCGVSVGDVCGQKNISASQPGCALHTAWWCGVITLRWRGHEGWVALQSVGWQDFQLSNHMDSEKDWIVSEHIASVCGQPVHPPPVGLIGTHIRWIALNHRCEQFIKLASLKFRENNLGSAPEPWANDNQQIQSIQVKWWGWINAAHYTTGLKKRHIT